MAQKESPPSQSEGQHDEYITQEKKGFRQGWPAWMKQLPQWRFPERNDDFQLIDRKRMRELLANHDPEAVKRLENDLDFLEHELLRLFRERDHNASQQQNRYRLYQILYMSLATLASLVGSLQALSLAQNPDLTAIFAFLETVIAAFVTFLATISGREPPLPQWLLNRRRAEYLRREYFRFLINLPPYDEVEGLYRRRMLSERAADIYRGVFPDRVTSSSEG